MGTPLFLGNNYLAISATLPHRGGLHAHRIVLRYFPEASEPYVTHMQVIPASTTGTTPYYVHGHYFRKLSNAFNDFAERATDRLTYVPGDDHYNNEHRED